MKNASLSLSDVPSYVKQAFKGGNFISLQYLQALSYTNFHNMAL